MWLAEMSYEAAPTLKLEYGHIGHNYAHYARLIGLELNPPQT